MMKFNTRALIAAGLLSSLGLAAVAQPAPAPAANGSSPAQVPRGPGTESGPAHEGMRDGMRDGRGMHDGMREQFKARRLARLKETLRITPAQEGAWTAYTNALRPVRHQRPDIGEMARLTTPERIDRMRSLRSQRIAEMDRRGDATKSLYASLSAEQKRVFDQITLRRGARGDGHEGRHRHSHHG